MSTAAAWPSRAAARSRSWQDLFRPFPSRGLALLIATGFGVANVRGVTPMGPATLGLSTMVVLGSVRAALVSPRDFPLFLAVYLPYSRAYPMQLAGGVNLTNALILLGVVAWVRSWMEPHEPAPLGWMDFAIGAYLVVGALGALHANESAAHPLGAALWDFKDWARPFLFYFLVRGLLEDRSDVRSLAIVLFYSATVVGVSTWHEGIERAGSSIEESRAGGPVGQANSNGAFLVYYGVPMLAMFLRSEARGARRGLMLAGFLVTVRAILFTYSRGAYFALVAAVACMLLLRSPLHLGLAATVGWSAAATHVLPASVLARLGQTTSEDAEIYDPDLTANLDKSSRERLVLWDAARAMIRADPWRGVGLNRFAETVDAYVTEPLPEHHPRDAHNAYLLTAAELGLPGLAIMVLNLASLLALAVYLYFARRHPLDRGLALGAVGTIFGVIVSCLFGSRFSDDAVIGYFWILAALLIVVRSQGPDQQSEVSA